MNPHGFVHRTEISIRPCFFGFLGSTIMNPYYLQMEFQLSIIYDSSDGHLEPHLVCCIHLVWTCQTANFGCVSPLCWLVLNIILDRSSVFGWFLPHSNVLQLLNHQNGWSLVQRPRCFATMVNAYARATAVEGADRWLSVMEKDESRGKPGVNQYRKNKPPIFWWFKKHHKTPK